MRQIQRTATDVTLEVYAVDAVTGAPKTGITAGEVTAWYVRSRSAAVTLATTNLAGPSANHIEGGFVEIDAAACPGWYRFDLPDSALADGARGVVFGWQAAGASFAAVEIELVAATIGDLASEVHLCKAALVNRRVHTVSTGVDRIQDDDGATTLVTLTPGEDGDDTIVITPS